MKKVYPLLLSFILFAVFTKAQYVVIPDDHLRNFLMNKYPSCFTDSTGRLDTTCRAILTEDSLDISSLNINYLTGIEYFRSLEYLDFSYNGIEVDDGGLVFPNSITHLKCVGTLYGNGTTFSCGGFPAGLTYLDCSGNRNLNNFNVPASLTYLDCSGNNISSLPDLPNSLTYLDCSNQVDNVSELLYRVLASLPKLPDSLKVLNCNSNELSSLPELPRSLTTLDCSDMRSGGYTEHNFVPSLFCLPALPATLTSLTCDSVITCLPNIVPGLQTSIYNFNAGLQHPAVLPVCDPTNDVNHCQGFPVISGNVFYDMNSNGIKDSNEIYASNISLQLTGNKNAFSDGNGYYEISPDSIGSYTLSVNAPVYYKAFPDSINYNFGVYDTTAIQQDIALQPIATVDSLQISIIPLNATARPGGDFPYLISYYNRGTTSLSTNIIFNYKSLLLNYNSSTDSSVVNDGDQISLPGVYLAAGQSGSFTADFVLNSADVPGEVLFTNATITANATSANAGNAVTIKGSYDPNNKQATSQLTPHEVAEGKSINYIVHFQNTGNDIAYNIVIADTLSNLLDVTSVQVNASSQPCKVTVNGNVVYFEFLNILLPDSNTNESGSHGFVSFNLKPLATVSSGSISNTASIYFDYNTPVATNTATTLIQDSSVNVPLILLSFHALTKPGSANALLYWTTANELNTRSFIVEQSTNDRDFTDLGMVAAKGYNNNSYNYNIVINSSTVFCRLKMIDNNGQYTYSNIIKIKGMQNDESFIVLTDPAKKIITIKTSASSLTNTTGELINSEGAVIKYFLLQQGIQTIDVNGISSGLYFIKTELTTKKVIVNN